MLQQGTTDIVKSEDVAAELSSIFDLFVFVESDGSISLKEPVGEIIKVYACGQEI